MRRKPQFHRADGGQIDIRAPGRQDHTIVEEIHLWHETEVHHHHEEARHIQHGEAPRIEIDKEPTRVRIQGGAPISEQHRIAGGGEMYRGQIRDAGHHTPQRALPRYADEPLDISAPEIEDYREPAHAIRQEARQQARPLPVPAPQPRQALPDRAPPARSLPAPRQLPAPEQRQSHQSPALPAPKPKRQNTWGSILLGPTKPRSR
jgi:hypothetical protein